jgi:hypothetical protein
LVIFKVKPLIYQKLLTINPKGTTSHVKPQVSLAWWWWWCHWHRSGCDGGNGRGLFLWHSESHGKSGTQLGDFMGKTMVITSLNMGCETPITIGCFMGVTMVETL